jgi:hypothetical protein
MLSSSVFPGATRGTSQAAIALVLAEKLPHFYAVPREDAREDTVLKLLATVSSEACEQRGSCYKVSAVPLLILAALFDDVYMVADLKREVLGLGRIEGVCADGKGDCGQWLPGHGGGGAVACAMGRGVCCSRRGCE